MSISTTDLKIYKAQRNRDTADGGGAMSPNEVVDGEINNVFDDISTEDRVTGRVSIRKVYPGVFSNNTDKFFGAGLLIINPAEDPAVDVLMTRKTAYDDERSDVVERIQSYLIPGATITWRLFNDHLQGTGSLTLYGFPDTSTPELGDTIFLEDTADASNREPVRVGSIVSRSTQTFEDEQGTFQRDILVIQITRPLQNDWEGTQVQRTTGGTPPTRLRTATIASGAKYYGVKQVEEDITAGDLTVKVPTPFGRVVPSTTAEQALTDERASLSGVSYAKAGADNAISVSSGAVSFLAGETKDFFIGGTVFPGSVAISGTFSASDPGTGTLTIAGSTTSATVDYETGTVSVTRQDAGSISITMTATPGAAVVDSTLTSRITVTPQTRALNYVRTLRPLPAPGSISVDYRVLENWYRLRDNGAGTLSGSAPGQGGGTINYGTGTITATLAELPDVSTDIIISWGTGVNISDLSGDVAADTPEIRGTLANVGIQPGSLTFEYLHSASTVTIEDDGLGNLDVQGGATDVGRIVYATGEYAFRPTNFPDEGSNLVAAYNLSTQAQEQFTPTPTGGSDTVSFTLAALPRPGSIRIDWSVTAEENGRSYVQELSAVDDGVGGLVMLESSLAGGVIAGATVNYGTGAISFNAARAVQWRSPQWEQGPDVDGQNNPVVSGFSSLSTDGRFEAGGTITVNYQEDAASTSADTETITVPPIGIELAPLTASSIVPGSVRFTLNGRTYVDRQGDLVYGASPTTNAGTIAGTINYSTGRVEITGYSSTGDFNVSVTGLASQAGVTPTSRLFFRTTAAPISPASLTVQAVRYDTGALIQATADSNGDITGTGITGFVDVDTGVVNVRFGEIVTAAGNEAEWWYDADQVDGGNIFKPILITPGSAFFSAVALQSIPLDPGILGLDPILLPSTGRVPIFGAGDSLMIVQRAVVEDATPSAGSTKDTGINNVQWIRIRDANGADVLSEHYTLDGPTGVVTWANPLDLSAYTGPYSIEALAYFKRLCTDVQVNGTIGLASAAPFSMANADGQIFLASKLIFQPDGGNQDLQALAFNLFTQSTWTGVWSNDQIGSGTTGQYDDVNYPIVMSNNGSITERWRIEFVTSTTVNVIGERFGQVLTAVPIGSNIAPINPATSTPYFTIDATGWSGGWSTGNIVRFNTLGANDPVWFIRTTQPGDAPELTTDQFIAHLQGDTAQE